jgi:DNA-binding MarR family transcriptional regulator
MRNHAPDSFYIRSPRLNQLLILKELAADPNLTQAELARRCELSVAMVNNYMKELSSLGWLQYRRKSSKSVSYHLTEAGRQQIEAVEADLVQEMANRFATSKARIRERILSQVPRSLQRVVLVGIGDLAEIVFHALESVQIGVVAVCDYDTANIGRDWCGRKTLDPSQILYLKPDAVIIADTSRSGEILASLKPLLDYGIQVISLGGKSARQNGNGPPHELLDPVSPSDDPVGLVPSVKATP